MPVENATRMPHPSCQYQRKRQGGGACRHNTPYSSPKEPATSFLLQSTLRLVPAALAARSPAPKATFFLFAEPMLLPLGVFTLDTAFVTA